MRISEVVSLPTYAGPLMHAPATPPAAQPVLDGGWIDRLGLPRRRGGEESPALADYADRFERPLDMLALCTIWFVACPPSEISTTRGWVLALWGLRVALSLVYLVDITARARLSGRPGHYLKTHLLGVCTVVFPALRVLVSLRLLRSVFQRGEALRFAVAAGTMFLNLTAVVYFFERHAEGATITSIPFALWWAAVTLFTVGYGDYAPVTWQGRVAAVALMLVGFTVLATFTAQISSAFIDQAARARQQRGEGREGPAEQLSVVLSKLEHLEAQLDRFEANGVDGGTAGR